MDFNNEELLHRNATRLAWLMENQRQLVRDIQERYNELGMAVDHLRSYFSSDSSDDQNEQNIQSASSKSTSPVFFLCVFHLYLKQLIFF